VFREQSRTVEKEGDDHRNGICKNMKVEEVKVME
jgi:hypothetical protein